LEEYRITSLSTLKCDHRGEEGAVSRYRWKYNPDASRFPWQYVWIAWWENHFCSGFPNVQILNEGCYRKGQFISLIYLLLFRSSATVLLVRLSTRIELKMSGEIAETEVPWS
jgi:hypothetical protein